MIEMMASVVVIQVFVHIIQTTLVMVVMYWVFDNPFEGSLVTLSSLMMVTGFAGMFFGNKQFYIVKKKYLNAFYKNVSLQVLC